MGTLPFRDLPLTDQKAPPEEERVQQLKEVAGGDLLKYSVGFVCAKTGASAEEDYYVPIGFSVDGSVVTSLEAINEQAGKLYKLEVEEQEEVKEHLEWYYKKCGQIPPWGERAYDILLEKGRTPRVLEGPHKGGCLRPNQYRYIILDSNDDIIFGPLLPK